MKQPVLVAVIAVAFGAGLAAGLSLRTDSPDSEIRYRESPPIASRGDAAVPRGPPPPSAPAESIAPPVVPPPAPAPAKAATDAEAILGIRLPENPTAKDLRDAARRLGTPLQPKEDPRLTLRAELLERVLRDFPADEKSQEDLIYLSHLLLSRGESDRLVAALDAYATKASLPSWEVEHLRAGVATLKRDWPAARTCYQRIADDAGAPEWKRVDAEFWVAYSVKESGDSALARSLFQGILDRHGSTDDPHLRNSVGGAREQIRLIDEAKK